MPRTTKGTKGSAASTLLTTPAPIIPLSYIGMITMGGTIQSEEDSSGKEIPEPAIDFTKFVEKVIRPHNHRLVTSNVCCLDSRDITDEHREIVFQEISRSPLTKFLLLHGTYTMEYTLSYLGKRLEQLEGKTVIGVASFWTAVDRSSMKTDALFNLGGAFYALKHAVAGIYLAMHGELFSWHEIRKDVDQQLFVRKS